ncbi:MAG: hypothetical protein IKN09_02690 [Clostridia bacterium]|nr:hypothetical protein [Clostridia bacterium]
MLKEKIKYVDYNGLEREEDFYFNLNKVELVELQLNTPGGFDKKLSEAIEKQDIPSIVSIVKDLVIKSYGVKSEDGKRFIKSKDLTDSFVQSEAYNTLFMKIVSDADYATKFINSIIPVIDEVKPQIPNTK